MFYGFEGRLEHCSKFWTNQTQSPNGTNEIISAVCISWRRSGAMQGPSQLQKAKRFSDQEVGMWSGIIRMRTTIFEYLFCARHRVKCFILKKNCTSQWEHNLQNGSNIHLKKVIIILFSVFVLRWKIDFILL